MLSALIALVATVYAFGATTPQDALASGHVEYVPLDWSLKPAGIGPGERFRLIFLSSTKRDAASSDIETYNTFVQNRAAAGHANIQDHSLDDSGSSAAPKPSMPATTPGPTPMAPESRSTGWAATRSPTTTQTSTTARGTMRPTTGTNWATTPTIPPRPATTPGPAVPTTARSLSQASR